jgi:integrase
MSATAKGGGSVRKRGATFTCYWWVDRAKLPTKATKKPSSDLTTDRVPDRFVQRSKGGFTTERAARKYLNERLGEISKGTYSEIQEKQLTVGEFLTRTWLPYARTRPAKGKNQPMRPSTIAWIELVVNKWVIPNVGGIRLSALSPVDVERALTAIADGGGRKGAKLSARSVNAANGVLTQALDYAVTLGYAQRNAATGIGRRGTDSKPPTPWTVDEARAFLISSRLDRLYAAWLLLLSRGLRRGELAGVRWTSVDLETGTLRIEHARVEVNGKTLDSDPKTKASQRTLSLDPTLVAAIREHKRSQAADRLRWGPAWTDSGLVFVREDGQGYAPRSISQRFERLIAEAKLRPIRLHDTRHTAASLMLASGVPVKIVQEMLGHSDPSITLAIYTHTTDAQHRAAGAAHTSVLTALP